MRALDDPVVLERAAGIMRRALARQEERESRVTAAVKAIVDKAPPLTEVQRAKLSALLRGAADQTLREQFASDTAEDIRAVRRNRRRRKDKDPADIVADFLVQKIEAVRETKPRRVTEEDRIVQDARQIMERLGVPLSEALVQACAGAEARRIDARRRAEHADGHSYCIPTECVVAAKGSVEEGDAS